MDGDARLVQSAVVDNDANKKVVTEFIDGLFSRGDLSAVDTYLVEDFVNHDPPLGAPADREGMRSAAALFRTAFPDWHSDLHVLIWYGWTWIRLGEGWPAEARNAGQYGAWIGNFRGRGAFRQVEP